MNVLKRNGKTESFNEKKIHKCAARACRGLENVDPKTVVFNATVKLFDGVNTTEIDLGLIKSARELIEQEPEYSLVASRLLLNTLYKDVFKENVDSDALDYQYRKSFVTNLKKLVKGDRVNKELLKFDLPKIAAALQPDNDYKFEYMGLQAVVDRYLLRLNGDILEAPQSWLMRVAMGLALGEKDNREDWAIKFYNQLSSFDYMCSTPTLFYSGTTRGQLSSCFLNTFEDSIFGIFDGLHQEAQKSKYAGGLGMDFTPFRAGGAKISSTGGLTTGAVYTWKMFNDMLVAVNQGGKRKGAGCGYLETWHYDIEDFLELRKNTGDERRRTHDMNTANWIPDLFLEQVEVDGPWYLFSPEEVPDLHDLYGDAFRRRYWEYVQLGKEGKLDLFREVNAKDLWKKMLKMLFETGHPWITFKDPCNIRYTNSHDGVVHSSNLCTEITLQTSATQFEPNNDRKIKKYGETAVCNLGSINLASHVKITDLGTEIDWEKLAQTIKVGSRMLDNVIDINFYPTQEAKLSNKKHRPVGMGSMGWHDLFLALDVDYDSEEAVELSGKIYEFIALHTINASAELAKERGKYSTYEGSLWSQDIFPQDSYGILHQIRGTDDIAIERLDWSSTREKVRTYGMRNSNTMAIAPTATISTIVGCSPTTEPWYANVFVSTTLSGDFTIVNKWLVADLKKLGLWNHNTSQQLKACDGDISQVKIEGLSSYDHNRLAKKYKTVFQVDQLRMIDAANERGKWVDQAMSLNLFSITTSLKELHEMYMRAWKKGLKTTYYLRTKGASAVEKSTVDSNKILSSIESAQPKACSLFDASCESCQ